MRIRIDEAFELQMGKTPSRNNPLFWGGENKWISISDMGNIDKYINATKECITDMGVKSSGIKQVPKDTLLMSFKLSIGKTAITSENMYTNEAIMAFIDKRKIKINIEYIYYLFKGIDWNISGNKAVMGITLNKKFLSEKEIEIPTIEKQDYVVKVLDKINKLIALQKEQLKKLDKLVKSMFHAQSKKLFSFSLEVIRL